MQRKILLRMRNTKTAVILVTAGGHKDADHEEYYGDNDSTLSGVEHLKKDLKDTAFLHTA